MIPADFGPAQAFRQHANKCSLCERVFDTTAGRNIHYSHCKRNSNSQFRNVESINDNAEIFDATQYAGSQPAAIHFMWGEK